ncbi:MAG: radical SAM protein [Planctomycetes bacterium]|nr:radical SAM protein [Planctomycetota bacterium]
MGSLYDENYIRPPNEADSVVIRVTRGCGWNRCRFCGIYTAFGVPFEIRPIEHVLGDVARAWDVFGPDARTFFLADADPIAVEPESLARVTRSIRKTFPRCERITCYGRMATAWHRRKSLRFLKEAGLDRIHAGLETGDDELLRFHRKGISQRRMVDAGRAVVESGIQLSFYVLLGLGGADRWRQHVEGTVKALNAVRPHFVRFRRLWVHPRCPLREEIAAGQFTEQTPEGTVIETRDILAGIDFPCEVECLHYNNCVHFECSLPADRASILSAIADFLARSPAEKDLVYRRPPTI